MATITAYKNVVALSNGSLCSRRVLSLSCAFLSERFGSANGDSGWRWDKNGVGMGGKESGPATEIKTKMGKGKEYQVPEYFKYDAYSFYDLEKEMIKSRVPQPKSGLSEFW